MTALEVVLSNDYGHVNEVLVSCSRSLYSIRILKSRGLPPCRVRFELGGSTPVRGVEPPSSQCQPTQLIGNFDPGGRIIQTFNPPVQYFQHILTTKWQC